MSKKQQQTSAQPKGYDRWLWWVVLLIAINVMAVGYVIYLAFAHPPCVLSPSESQVTLPCQQGAADE